MFQGDNSHQKVKLINFVFRFIFSFDGLSEDPEKDSNEPGSGKNERSHGQGTEMVGKSSFETLANNINMWMVKILTRLEIPYLPQQLFPLHG